MADAVAQGSAAVSLGEFEAAAQASSGEYPSGSDLQRANEYTGKLFRGEDEGTVRGWLIDRLGYRIEFSGCKDPRTNKGGGYLIIGRLAHIPTSLRVEAIDG